MAGALEQHVVSTYNGRCRSCWAKLCKGGLDSQASPALLSALSLAKPYCTAGPLQCHAARPLPLPLMILVLYAAAAAAAVCCADQALTLQEVPAPLASMQPPHLISFPCGMMRASYRQAQTPLSLQSQSTAVRS